MSKADLSKLAVHETAQVRALLGPEQLVNRLRELGFVAGEQVTLVNRILWSEPLFVEVRGQTFALRIEEAKCIQI